MRSFLVGALALLLSACATVVTPVALQDIDLQQATVRVATISAHGSGVLIAPDLVMTAKHVTEDAGEPASFTITYRDGSLATATVEWASEKSDLAILKLDKPSPITPLPVRCSPVKVGEAITIIGQPLRMTWVETRGFVASDFTNEGLTILDATAAPGSSGGPVLDASGNVVGTLTAITVGPLGPYPVVYALSLMTPVKAYCETHADRPTGNH